MIWNMIIYCNFGVKREEYIQSEELILSHSFATSWLWRLEKTYIYL